MYKLWNRDLTSITQQTEGNRHIFFGGTIWTKRATEMAALWGEAHTGETDGRWPEENCGPDEQMANGEADGGPRHITHAAPREAKARLYADAKGSYFKRFVHRRMKQTAAQVR